MSEPDVGPSLISRDNVKQLLATVTFLPRSWVILMCVIAIASTVRIQTDGNGIPSWQASVGPLSLIALGLIWLPTALRYLVLAGGSVSAAGVQATTGGLLSDRLIGDLADIRSRTERIGQDAPDTLQSVHEISSTIDDIVTRYVASEDALSDDMLDRYARRYENLREEMPPGGRRTEAMDKLLNEVYIRAAAAPTSARRIASTLLKSPRPGDRVVGLALVEAAPTADAFDDVIRIFSSSLSAFEQFHSLNALAALTPALNTQQREQATTALQHEKTDPRGVGLMSDVGIPFLIDDVLKDLQRR